MRSSPVKILSTCPLFFSQIIRNNFFPSYYIPKLLRFSNKTSPRSGGLIEVLIEASSVYPGTIKIAEQIINKWMNTHSFKEYGFFFSINFIDQNKASFFININILENIYRRVHYSLPRFDSKIKKELGYLCHFN